MAFSQIQKAPRFWTGEDCRTWAAGVCEKYYFSQFDVNLNAFEELSGRDLLGCSQQDLVNRLGHQYGKLFYKELITLKNNSTHWVVNGNEALVSNSASVNISGSSLDGTHGFNFQPHMLLSEPSHNTSYTLPGLRSTAQMQHTHTTQETYMAQEPFDTTFTNEQLQDLQNIDETIIEDLSKYLQASNITEFTNGYSESNNIFYPSDKRNFTDSNYSLLESSNVSDMHNTNAFTSNTLRTDQSLFGATGFTYDNIHQSYGTGYDDGFISEEPYDMDHYDYSLYQDIKPNLAEQDKSNKVPDMNITKTQEEHDCLFDSIQNPNRKSRRRGPKVWEFVLRCLLDPRYNPSLLCWENQSTATFQIVQPEQLARLWGARTGKPDLSYENFSRSLRYHYKHGMLEGLTDRQLVYRFTPQALQAFTRNKNVHS